MTGTGRKALSGAMRQLPYSELLIRALGEYRRHGTIFELPRELFVHPRAGLPILGPAAGPHTQLAQNILCAWLAGGRYFELKTVQALDELTVSKPCIDASDEGYNVEWSTELTLPQAYDEYLKAWFLLHVLERLVAAACQAAGRERVKAASSGAPPIRFTMSVGYDLAGITSQKVDLFINRLIDSYAEPLYHRYIEETSRLAADRSLGVKVIAWPIDISPKICASATLSTMHGCPPAQIESICSHLLVEKKLDTLVKLNPTLLGYQTVKEMLGRTGFTDVELDEEGFGRDLHYAEALPMLRRLAELAAREGRRFGVKLSNTLAVRNTGAALPGAEMYMSGRALYPITMSLAAKLSEDFAGALPISFSGGASAWNLAAILDAGIRPVTVATELLKPGGYGRLNQLADIAARHAADRQGEPDAGEPLTGRVDSEKARTAAEAALSAPQFQKEYRGKARVHAEGLLPLFDCFVAPCVTACPIGQEVPLYIHQAGLERFPKAFAVIHERNPLPFITGYLCDHQCEANCTRLDWDQPVRIREMKRISAERGYADFRQSGSLSKRMAAPRAVGTALGRVKVAVVGAGPAGLAASSFLAREGFEIHVFEREEEPGGVVRYLLPGFRVPADAVEKDVSLLHDMGVQFHFGQGQAQTIGALKKRGYSYILVAVGAEAGGSLPIEGALDALSFLRQYRKDAGRLSLGRAVAVIGAGDTAMDAARAAKRSPGVEEVRVVYRRSRDEMPASREEYEAALAEGIRFHFLRSPLERTQGGSLVCRVMALGEADESGRRKPVPTEAMETLPADSVIAAIGAGQDSRALSGLGLSGGDREANAVTQETPVEGVFLIGDAACGADTIVKAIASARRAADAICIREGGSRSLPQFAPREDPRELRARRGRVAAAPPRTSDDGSVLREESSRCLGCDALCLKCVEVCPNRANAAVLVPGGHRDAYQVVHLDGPCNECGNCATFCPWDGRPYKDKLTLYETAEDFSAGTNPGFFLRGAAAAVRLGAQVWEFPLDGSSEIPQAVGDASTRAVIRAILRDYPYLLGRST